MFYDTDCGGVVSNIAYLRFVEQARTELLTRLGWPLEKCVETAKYPVVLRTEIDYRQPAVLGDLVRVEAQIVKLQRVRFVCDFTLIRDRDDSELANCSQTVAFVALPEKRPIPVPEHWLNQARLGT